METNLEILELIKGCLNKHPNYQRQLVDNYSGLLYVICKRYLKEGNSSQDALQDSLIKIFQNLNKFDARKGSFNAWISTVTIRVCLTKINRSKLSYISLDEIQLSQVSCTIESDILDKYDSQYLVKLIAELKEEYRIVFNMAAIDGYSHKEIGELLGIKESSSRARLTRAKNMLKDKVDTLKKSELWVSRI